MNKKIGQVTGVVHPIAGEQNRVEVTFDWVQPGRGFETLKGQSVEYERSQPVGRVRLGIKGQDRQAIVFEESKKQLIKNGSFSALIRWGGEDDECWPEFLCVASKSDFDAVVKQLKEEQEKWVDPSLGREKKPEKKPKQVKNTVHNNVIDIETERQNAKTVFRVTSLGHTFCGKTLQDIVNEATRSMGGEDPRPTLLCPSAEWEERGIMGGQYVPTERPMTLPPSNQFLLKKEIQKAE